MVKGKPVYALVTKAKRKNAQGAFTHSVACTVQEEEPRRWYVNAMFYPHGAVLGNTKWPETHVDGSLRVAQAQALRWIRKLVAEAWGCSARQVQFETERWAQER